MIYQRLTPAQSLAVRAGYRAMLELSQTRRREFLLRRDMVQAAMAIHFGPTAAGELADIQLDLTRTWA